MSAASRERKTPPRRGWWDERARGSLSPSRSSKFRFPRRVPAYVKDFSAPAWLPRARCIGRVLPFGGKLPQRFNFTS
jgi:hypothetical protein